MNEPGGATVVVRHNSSSPGVRYFSALAFTPDNASLFAFIVHQDWTRQLARISVKTGRIDVLKSLDWRTRGSRGDQPALSPDGRFIAYAALRTSPSSNDARLDSTDRDIYILAADASSETVVVSGASVNSSPVWSPDGSRLFFLSNRGGGGTRLWSIAVRDGKAADDLPILVRDLTGDTRLLGMVESGGLYFMRGPNPRDDIYIAEYDAASGIVSNPKRLTAGIADSTFSPTWSHDGRFVAFRRSRGAGTGYQTGIRSIETGAEVAYPPGLSASGLRVPVRWLPDGRRLLEWVPASEAGPPGFYRVDLETREIRLQIPANQQIPADQSRRRLTAFNAVSDKTLYAVLRTPDGRSNRIGAVDIETGQLQIEFEVPGLSTINGMALSPNGRTLAVIGTPAKPQETNEVRKRFEQQFARIDVDGGTHQVLVPSFLIQQVVWAQTLTWTRDGRHVLFGESGEFASPEFGVNRVMRIAAGGGSPAFTGLALPSINTGSLDFDPTGRQLVFNSRESFAPELWVLEPVTKR